MSDEYVLSVDLISDAYLQMEELERSKGKELSDEKYAKVLEQKIGLAQDFHLIKVFKSQEAVSYTHLDVYKRQLRKCRAFLKDSALYNPLQCISKKIDVYKRQGHGQRSRDCQDCTGIRGSSHSGPRKDQGAVLFRQG